MFQTPEKKSIFKWVWVRCLPILPIFIALGLGCQYQDLKTFIYLYPNLFLVFSDVS